MGINNRDLTRFETDIGVTLSLKDRIGQGRLLVTESGIASPAVVARMLEEGVYSFLIGGALMSEPDPGQALAALFAGTLN